MAYNDNQNENPLPTPGDSKRSTSDLLPKFFRTEANRKFLQGTIDQMVQPGVAEKLNGFVGRKTAKAYTSSDNYVGDISTNRENYQLEPAAVVKDNLDNVVFYKDYNDYLGSLDFFGSNTANQDRLNKQDTYAWNPHIDWDKFVNFREYYWLPSGPLSIPVRGQQREVISTYTVSTVTDDDNTAYIFNDGFERNPTLKLYRGQTYRFEIDAPGHPIAFAITRSFTPGAAILTAGIEGLRASGLFDGVLYGNEYDQGDFIVLPSSGSVTFEEDDNVSTLYPDGIRKLGEDGEEIATVYIEKGTIEFTIPINAPDRLFYVSKNNIDTSGLFRIYDIEENTFLDVDADIIGKKTYTTADGFSLSNGMKLKFTGDVEPAKYSNNAWYVEGVGDKIRLIKDTDLTIPGAYSENRLIPFDTDKFDNLPFANASAYAADKDYLVSNRASLDKNAWSRYNRWFHRDVIETSFIQNNLPIDIDEDTRAKRPIIEFEAGLKLFQFGTFAKQDVDLVDTFTTDVFSNIEGQIGYNVDGVDFADGMRVLFTADTDVLVQGKIFQVNFIKIGPNRQISLIETDDTIPLENETIFVTQGNINAGKTFYFDGSIWQLAQEKNKTNQPPRFDLCCPEGNSYADTSIFDSSTFTGTKIFSYKEGSGTTDSELGFPLSYRNIENSGDILFDFNLLSDSFIIQNDEDIVNITTDTANLRKYTTRDNFNYVNAWSSTPIKSKQYVIRQYSADEFQTNNFEIDVYDKAGDLNDLKTIVYVNNQLKVRLQDYEIDRTNTRAFVRFYNDLNQNDIVIIKTNSATVKNQNGYYEFPHNLERNPKNEDIDEFTLGEVIDHVDSIIEEVRNFQGSFPGNSNIRDLGNVGIYGKKFVKHAGPVNLPLYHTTSKDYNIVKALRYSRDEYAKFKRVFLETASTLGFDGTTRIHVDRIIEEINKDKLKTQPFYFSDMLAYGSGNRIEYTVLDSRTTMYALTEVFDLANLSEKSVYVYLNNEQLTHGIDYTFDGQGFVLVDAGQQENDTIEIIEYSSTDGSFVAPTPTKLGLYPKYAPELTIDDTYQTAQADIEGPYKIYGQVAEGFFRENTRGWFYPVFTTQQAAEEYAVEQSFDDTGVHIHQFVGLNTTFYMPNIGSTHGGQDNIELDAYPIGVPMIRGHDGSFIRAYLDYRDNLLLEIENRIFNNIKVEWTENVLDIFGFLGGDFRSSEFTKQEVDSSLLVDFTQWLTLVDNDYTDNFFYDRLNEFTFNYSNANNPNGELVSGFWRGVYKRAFDTDRPHTCPWEMLGFTIKPSWWNQTYGPAPYTSDNLILWRDLEQGIVREPNKEIVIREKFARPGLVNFIPVDGQGNLLSPLSSSYIKNFVLRLSSNNLSFGDQGPVETAWRRSSQYPFAIITSMLLNKPAEVLGKGFDVSRININLAGQNIYSNTGKFISNQNLIFPNTVNDNTRTLTSGFVNYLYNLVASDILSVYEDYQMQLTTLTNQLGFKLGGFSDSNKLNFILESRTPQAEFESGVFVPVENYKVFFNTSSPVSLATYSGVAIEKTANGYVLRGYNNDSPSFEYYQPLTGSTSVNVTVGGISEASTLWEEETRYFEGQIIENNNSYYRATSSFESGSTFDTENLAKLPELPTTGGKTALFKKNFETRNVLSYPYGTLLSTTQEVVDFLLGYGARLEELGFTFDFVEGEQATVNDWRQAAREFLFWTTQGWASGTVITISPAANRFNFAKDFTVVDDIYDDFYNYSIVQADGQLLPREFGSLLRNQNSFGIETINTDEGLYGIALPLVQKEHVVLFDNNTIFNDIIYQPSTGYRRDRIKISGYRSADWNGGLNIPGFVYDNAETTDWEQWKDYTIGSLVKYKQFYYVAIENVVGSQDFNSNSWYRLNEKPEPELITNFDYRINQFSDFYDLDTDGFDAELQKMAQHLTGYQKRQYLANIINDDVSQYKFYQGMIQDKGTKNALSKMFDKLSSAGKESLEFYEEWALQVGRFGAVDNVQQVEFNLKQDKMQESPQSVELVNELPVRNFDKVYRILPFELYDKPSDYNHKPFPVKPLDKEYVRTAGYVNEDDVTYIAGTTEELNTGDVNLLGLGDYVWVTEVDNTPWNVYQHVATNAYVTQLNDDSEISDTGLELRTLILDKWAKDHIEEGDLIGVISAQDYGLTGIYTVDSTNLENVKIQIPEENEIAIFAEEKFLLTKLRSVRVDDLDELASLAQERLYNQQKVWIDSYNNDWTVLENNKVYENKQTLTNLAEFDSTAQEYGTNIIATPDNNNLFVTAPGDGTGKIFYYRRTKETFNLVVDQEIVLDGDEFKEIWTPNTYYNKNAKVYRIEGDLIRYYTAKEQHTSAGIFDTEKWIETNNPNNFLIPIDSGFGSSIDVSDDGEYLVVGMPTASGVKTRFKGDFDPDTAYNKNEIVKYRESLWKANREILPQILNQPFTTFDTYINIANSADADSTSIRLLVAGDPGLERTTDIIDHLLVRAPTDMYLGTKAGDTVNLFWNKRSYAYPTLDNYLPFDGEIPQITPEFLQQSHEIVEKIDHIFFVETFVTLPQAGDIVTTDTGQAEVFYVGTRRDSAVLYLKDTNGIFDISGELFIEDTDFVGFYTEEDTVNTSDTVSGFWYINAPNYSNNGRYYDTGRGLVYADVRLNEFDYDPSIPGIQLRELNEYYNIQSTLNTIGNYVLDKNQVSFITQLAYRGDPSETDGEDGVEGDIKSNKWVVRVGKGFSDNLEIGDTYEFEVYNLDNRTVDLESTGLSYDITNKNQEIVDLWDGYIDFEFTRFDFSGFAFQPQVGDTIEDVQTPRDGAGGLALTSTTTSSAEIVYLQRNFNSVRVYVKIISGTWDQLNNIGRYEIRRKANTAPLPDGRGPGDVDRIVGTVNDPNNDIAVGTNQVGKLLVFEADTLFQDPRPWNEIPAVTDEEYYFYNENTEQGVGREPNPPFSLNKDYTQIYNISADSFGDPGPDSEGAVAIYRKLPDGRYRLQRILVSEYGNENRGFGKQVKIKQSNNYYTLFVSSSGFGTKNDPGSIEIYRHGTKPSDNFRGEYKLTAYSEGDIVIYKDEYYVALKDTTDTQNLIQDPIYWNNISWRQGRDTNYRGAWDNSYAYAQGSIVNYLGTFYKAVTNIAEGVAFTNSNWQEVSALIDYIGYLPNFTGVNFYDEDVFAPAVDNPEETLVDFSKVYDVSDDAEVIIATTDVTGTDSTSGTKIAVYRQQNDKYILDQLIASPEEINSTDWAFNISMRPDGLEFAVSSQLDDSIKANQGKVFIYKQVDGQFELAQTLTPANDEENEQFGYNLYYGQENLVVSSLNGDRKIPTTFDASSDEETIFDNKFTNFNNVRLDTGVVYIFENLNNKLVYSEQFRYDTAQTEFGETLLAKNNHVYVGIPSYRSSDTQKGIVVNYRKPKGVYAWNTIRESVTPVDLTRIEGVFLYNKRTNRIVSYIDYIDPVQGKIPGNVEQELTYKIGFNPAVYNVGDIGDPTVDPARFWGAEHVGQTWWNINTARFAFAYQGSTSFQKNEWNRLMPSASIDIFEWVESDYLPSQWNQLADTDDGVALGISGTAIDSDNRYSAKLAYNEVSQTFSTKYYFWVQNKRTVPSNTNRNISIFEMANLIARPREQGYRFISFLGDDKFVLNNFDSLVTSDDLVLNIRYSTGPNKEQNTHAQYMLMSDGAENSRPDADIERKWFDSLIGFDDNNRTVPDTNIPVAKRYGIQNRPRQGMFVNRIEALKQTIERVNLVLEQQLVVDQYNIDRLFEKEEVPSTFTQKYDLTVDTFADLNSVSTNKLSPAILEPVILNGKLIRVNIVNSGRGYKVAPSVEIFGSGSNAEIELSINNLGQVISANVIDDGSGYDDNTIISTRSFTVLVNADENLNGRWSLYSYNNSTSNWIRTSLQDYDVSLYWNYTDWYAQGYNQFTQTNYEIDGTYQLSALNDRTGNVVKIKNVGAGGWLLLEKIASEDTEDYTINYKTIGRQNGTIQFKNTLYDYSSNTVGFDNRSFDSGFYDNNPNTELRIILETLRDDILITDLATEYNQLFFASLRYILSEQQRVDWLFKTSFISAKHNLGKLEQKINFVNNKLPSYEAYVNEVKPYTTKIREFVSAYQNLDNTNSSVTDFDNAPYYNSTTKRIETSNTIVQDGVLFGLENNASTYPRKYWADNAGYSIKEIRISNPGAGYTYEPTVRIESAEGSGATAKAYLGYGKITKIEVTNPGSGYITTPTIIIEGPQTDEGIAASASAILGNGLVRSPFIKIKFDRTAGTYTFEDLAETETFTGTNVNNNFDLEWPMDLNNKKVKVYVDGVEQLRSRYTFKNVVYETEKTSISKDFNYGGEDEAAGPGTQKFSFTREYTYEKGRITFATPPASDTEIRVEYYRPLSMLGAEDRINFAYNPVAGMFGKDLAQLMTGVDYGGVEVRGFDFGGPSGWDSQGWYTDTWDTFDNTFEDEIFIADGSTIAIELNNPLESGVEYNIYKNGIRLDDPNYDAGTPTNIDAIINTITGDGSQTIIELDELGIRMLDGDVLIVRKITSDGSIIPDPNSYDMALTGGDLAYETAKGVNPEEIIVDGDGFVTPVTSGGPEELVPGQVLDTLDIKVYTRESGGQGLIYSQSYIMDSNITVYDIGTIIGNKDSVLVKQDNVVLSDSQYTIDWQNNTIEIFNPEDGVEFNIISMSLGTQNIMDYGFITSTVATEYKTTVEWTDNASIYVTVDGIRQDVIVFNSSDIAGDADNRVAFRFDAPLELGQSVYWVVFNSNTEINYSQVSKDSFIADGCTTTFDLLQAPFYALPNEHNILVKVDNNVLNAGYNIEYTIPQTEDREYPLELFQQPVGSLSLDDVKVFLNGEELFAPNQWRLEIANSSIILSDEFGAAGDTVEIFVITDGEYRINDNSVIFETPPADNANIEIYQFSNHDIVGLERISYDVVSRSTLIQEDIEYVTYNRLKVGEITLRRPAVDAQYVWITLNGELLTPSVDYYVTDDKTKVRLVVAPEQNDVFEVIHFTAQVNVPKFAFRQFKDMLNRTHFKRLDASTTELTQDLNYYDLRIELLDASSLPEPNKGGNMPGIIWIDGERIEYFVKEDNTLRQLRRGTLGTGVKDIYTSGTKVFDQNINKTVPYKDSTLTQNFDADGVTDTFSLDFEANNENEVEVFVAGTRLRKTAIDVFDPEIALDSPAGDITLPAEFIVENNSIVLSTIPEAETKIVVIKKIGQTWTRLGESLANTDNSIARFLRAGTTELPK